MATICKNTPPAFPIDANAQTTAGFHKLTKVSSTASP